jgi:hypothetical protein
MPTDGRVQRCNNAHIAVNAGRFYIPVLCMFVCMQDCMHACILSMSVSNRTRVEYKFKTL